MEQSIQILASCIYTSFEHFEQHLDLFVCLVWHWASVSTSESNVSTKILFLDFIWTCFGVAWMFAARAQVQFNDPTEETTFYHPVLYYASSLEFYH